jgi:hypothetical protein
MKAQSPRKPSKQHMVAGALAFEVYEGGSARDLAALRQSMNTAQTVPMQELRLTLSCIALATAAFHGGKWEPLSVPEEDAGVDARQRN